MENVESKIYGFVDGLAEYVPIPNDRYRLSYDLLKYMRKDYDSIEEIVRTAKIKIANTDRKELAKKINEGLKNLESND